jgi:hypothetical protein
VLACLALFQGTSIQPVFIVGAGEADAYIAAGAPQVIEGGGLCASRNRGVAEARAQNKYCVQISDDLKKIHYLLQEKPWVRPTNVSEGSKIAKAVEKVAVSPIAAARFIEASMNLGAKTSCYLGGAYVNANYGWAMGSPPDSNDLFVVGDLMVIDPHSPVLFDEQMTLKEDYDFSCAHLQRHKRIYRSNRIIVLAAHYTNPGGAVTERDDDRERYNIAVLQYKWPGVFRLNGKRKRKNAKTKLVTEVIMLWKSRSAALGGKKEMKSGPLPDGYVPTLVSPASPAATSASSASPAAPSSAAASVAEKSKVAESEKSEVAESEKSKVAESEKSKVAEAEMPKVAESEKPSVEESEESSPFLGSLPRRRDNFRARTLDAAMMAGDFKNVWEALLFRFGTLANREKFEGLKFGGVFAALAKKGWLLWDLDMAFCMIRWKGKSEGSPRVEYQENLISIEAGDNKINFSRLQGKRRNTKFTIAVVVKGELAEGEGAPWSDQQLRTFWKPFSITNMTDTAKTGAPPIQIREFLKEDLPPTASCVLIALRHAAVDLLFEDLRAAAAATKAAERGQGMGSGAAEKPAALGDLGERPCHELWNLLSNAAMKDPVSGLLTLGRSLQLVKKGEYHTENDPVLAGGTQQWDEAWTALQPDMKEACKMASLETTMVVLGGEGSFARMHQRTCIFCKVGGRHMAGLSGAHAVNAPKPLLVTGDCNMEKHSGKQKHHAEQAGRRDNRQHLAGVLLRRSMSSRVSSTRKIWRVMLACREAGEDPSQQVSFVIREVCVNKEHGETLHQLSSIPQKEDATVQYFWRWIARAVWCAVWR